MAREPNRASPPGSAGGDEARELYEELTDDLLYDPAVGRSTMMGFPCVRLAGKFLATYDGKAGCLVVKLPSERGAQLIATGSGETFAPAGGGFREWVAIPAVDRDVGGCPPPRSSGPVGAGSRPSGSAPPAGSWPSSSAAVCYLESAPFIPGAR